MSQKAHHKMSVFFVHTKSSINATVSGVAKYWNAYTKGNPRTKPSAVVLLPLMFLIFVLGGTVLILWALYDDVWLLWGDVQRKLMFPRQREEEKMKAEQHVIEMASLERVKAPDGYSDPISQAYHEMVLMAEKLALRSRERRTLSGSDSK